MIPTKRTLRRLAVAGVTAILAGVFAAGSRAAAPPSTRGPIATLGNRTVDALDIQRAAIALVGDPLRRQNPALWRRMLLDRAVDRELLAMEAERRGIAKDPEVRQRIAEGEFLRLYQAVHQKILLPTVEPTGAQLDSLRWTGLYRMMDLYYILLQDNEAGSRRREAETIVTRLRQGARFDSIASTKSGHPSRGNGGHFGMVLVRDLDPGSHEAARTAKVGDVLGPYSGRYGHEIYKVGGFEELTLDSLKSLIRTERERDLIRDYKDRLLDQYHFALDPKMVQPVLFAVGSETPDSILASLSPDGTRPRHGVRPALGVIARVDGDSIGFGDLLRETHPAAGAHGRIRIRDESALRELAGQAFFRRLLVRDAKERGLVDDPRLERELRLIREGIAVAAMIERSRPADPGPAALQAWFDAHAARYRRAEAWRARVAVFPDRDSALAALRMWNGVGIADSSLRALKFSEQPRATASTLYPGHAATILVTAGDGDALALSIRTLDRGQTSPVVKTMQGYAVAHVLAREPARPMTLDEAMDRVRRDWREEKENEWVLSLLERMRATTPVRVVPARLEALKLGPAKGAASGGEASR
jgi:hypothetical protein